MSGNTTYGVTYTLVDRATKEINRINKAIVDARAPIDRAQKSMSKFTEVSGINSLGRGLGTLGGIARSTAGAVASMVPALGLLGGVASLAGLATIITRYGDVGTSIANAGYRASLSALEMEKWQNTLLLAGTSAEVGTKFITGLGDAVQNMKWGQNAPLAGLFQRFGLQTREANGDVLTLNHSMDAFWKIYEAQGTGQGSGQRKAQVIAMFGLPPEFQSVAERGKKSFENMEVAAAKLATQYPLAKERAYELSLAQKELTGSVETFTKQLGNEAAPALTDLTRFLSGVIDANKEWITQDMSGYIREFTTYLKTTDWKGVRGEITGVGSQIKYVVDQLGGWTRAGEIALAVFALPRMVAIVGSFIQIGRGVFALIAGLDAIAASVGFVALGTLAANLALVLAVHSDTPRNNNQQFHGEGDYDNPYSNPNNPNRAKTISQSIHDAIFGETTPADVLKAGSQPATREQLALGVPSAGWETRDVATLMKDGWSLSDASALIAQEKGESNGNINTRGDLSKPGGSHGLFQLDAERRARYSAWARQNAGGPGDFDDATHMNQVRFAGYEALLRGNVIRGAGLHDQTDNLLRNFEVAADREPGGRNSITRRGHADVIEYNARLAGLKDLAAPPVNVNGGTGASAPIAPIANTNSGSALKVDVAVSGLTPGASAEVTARHSTGNYDDPPTTAAAMGARVR